MVVLHPNRNSKLNIYGYSLVVKCSSGCNNGIIFSSLLLLSSSLVVVIVVCCCYFWNIIRGISTLITVISKSNRITVYIFELVVFDATIMIVFTSTSS